MTTISPITQERAPSDYEPLPARPSTFARFLRETWLLVARGLRTIPRVPTRLSDVTIQPIMFTLLFLYIFGSAIHIPGISYKNFLLPGLIGQSLAFGVIGAGVATATDFGSGVIDRFRSFGPKSLARSSNRSSASPLWRAWA
jgi:ABC-2 type transport system permease protein